MPAETQQILKPHGCPGKLFIVEGIDGSGKSTQIRLLERWLKASGLSVIFTEWNSAELFKKTTKKGKKKRSLTPTTFSLLHATDFAHRLVTNILPPLKAGMVVLADRYVYTAFARDVVRGCTPQWVRKVYSFAPKPDLSFYFRVPTETALKRLTMSRQVLKDFEAGLDLNLHQDPYTSFKIFQGRIADEYNQMISEFGLTAMDATASVAEQQRVMRQIVADHLEPHQRRIRIA
jgi:dTMP kinase